MRPVLERTGRDQRLNSWKVLAMIDLALACAACCLLTEAKSTSGNYSHVIISGYNCKSQDLGTKFLKNVPFFSDSTGSGGLTPPFDLLSRSAHRVRNFHKPLTFHDHEPMIYAMSRDELINILILSVMLAAALLTLS